MNQKRHYSQRLYHICLTDRYDSYAKKKAHSNIHKLLKLTEVPFYEELISVLYFVTTKRNDFNHQNATVFSRIKQ